MLLQWQSHLSLMILQSPKTLSTQTSNSLTSVHYSPLTVLFCFIQSTVFNIFLSGVTSIWLSHFFVIALTLCYMMLVARHNHLYTRGCCSRMRKPFFW